MFKVNNKDPERRQWRHSGVFIVNFEHISYLVLVFLLLALNIKLPARVLLRTQSQIKIISYYMLQVVVTYMQLCYPCCRL